MLKFIKKFFIFTLFITFIFSLTACDYGYFLYHENIHKKDDVASIELINYNNPAAQDNPLEKYKFDLEKLEILETLADGVDDFLIEISEIGGATSRFEKALNSPCGRGIRMTYLNGDFTLVTITFINGFDTIFVGEYDADANVLESFGIRWLEVIDDFKTLINKYFTEQI